MQQGSANVFCVYRHADLNKSELIAERVSYDEMHYAIHREEYLAKMINHNALSVMASFVEYDALLTRCHIWEVDAGMCNTECNKCACSNVHNCQYEQDKLDNSTTTAEYMQNCMTNWNSLVEAVAMEITQHLPRSSLIECGRASHQLHCVGAFVLCHQEGNFWSKENLTQNDYSANNICVHNKYHMGVITHGVAHDIKILELIDRLSIKVFHAYPHYNNVVVPIAADLRHVQLKVWWTPCLERVTPLSTLPLLRVTLEEVCSPQLYIKKQHQQEYNQKSNDNPNNHYNILCEGTNAQCNSVIIKDKHECQGETTHKRELSTINTDDTLYFIAYTKVELFLCRPIHSELIGTCVQYVKHDNALSTQLKKALDYHEQNVKIDDSTRKQNDTSYAKQSIITTQTTITEQVQKLLGDNDVALHNNNNEHAKSARKNHQRYDKVQMKKIWSRSSRSGVMQAHLIFDDLVVSHTGEHLIGVQVEVNKSYRPFVPVLCAYINPFLVVERDDA